MGRFDLKLPSNKKSDEKSRTLILITDERPRIVESARRTDDERSRIPDIHPAGVTRDGVVHAPRSDSRGRPPARCALPPRSRSTLSALHARRPARLCKRLNQSPSSSSAADPSRAPPVPVVLPRRASVGQIHLPLDTPEPAFAPFFSTDRRTLDAEPGPRTPPGPGAYAMNAIPRRPAAVSAASPRHAAPRRAASSPPDRGGLDARAGELPRPGRMDQGRAAVQARRPGGSAARRRRRGVRPPAPALSSPPPPRVAILPATPTRAPRRSAALPRRRARPSRTLRLAATERAASIRRSIALFVVAAGSAPRSASRSAVDVDSSISIDPVDALGRARAHRARRGPGVPRGVSRGASGRHGRPGS